MSKINIADVVYRMDMRIAELGMTKEDFYKKSGISSASYSQWKTGVHIPSPKKLAQAASALNVTVDYLVNGTENKPAAKVSGELDEEEVRLASAMNAVASEMGKIIVALEKDPEYRLEIVDKKVDVVCPKTSDVERIDQSYIIHEGKRVPLMNHGCKNFTPCAECYLCQMRVMESVR